MDSHQMAAHLAKNYGPDVADRYLKILATPRPSKSVRGMVSPDRSGCGLGSSQLQEKILAVTGEWVTAAQIRESVGFPCSISWIRLQMSNLEDSGKLERRKLEGKRLEFRAIVAEDQEVPNAHEPQTVPSQLGRDRPGGKNRR